MNRVHSIAMATILGVSASAWGQGQPRALPPAVVNSEHPNVQPFGLGADSSAPAVRTPLPVKSKSENRTGTLTRENGPWMVRVASFVDEDDPRRISLPAHELAAKLAAELSAKHSIEAFTYCYQVDPNLTKYTEEYEKEYERKYYTKPRRVKYASPPPANWIVLAGNFKSEDDSAAKSTLKKIRKIKPESIDQNIFGQYRFSADELPAELRGALVPAGAGLPLSTANMVRNPVLSQEERESRQQQIRLARAGDAKAQEAFIDPKTAKMLRELNDQPENAQLSIYNLNAKYTIMVQSFAGVNVVGNEKHAKSKFRLPKKEGSLGNAAANAIVLATALRKLGYQAWVFHGQYGSIVCLGGYSGQNDPKLYADLEKYSQLRVGELRLQPRVILTPRRPQ